MVRDEKTWASYCQVVLGNNTMDVAISVGPSGSGELRGVVP